MGQYWKVINLDKKQYLNGHDLDCGLKLWEQIANPRVGQALVILLAAQPERRGGGDIEPDPIIGSWAGDRIVMVGDYSEDEDLPSVPEFGSLYAHTYPKNETEDGVEPYTNVSANVRRVLDRELSR